MTEMQTRRLKDSISPIRRAKRFRLGIVGGASIDSAIAVRVGSKEGNALRIENASVSRYHFDIEPSPDGFILRDLGSTNGTFVNGLRVRELFLPEKAQLRAGEVKLTYELLPDDELIELSPDDRFGEVLGSSPPMRELFSVLARVAPRELTVLIEGESGTGKERVAESIHQRSARASGPFVVVDCASIPPSLMESELFGHDRGAFTGAEGRRVGRFEEASGGTIVLDELGELPTELQPKLLRVLEQRQVRRVGGSTLIPIDVRVVAATNRDLAREVNRGAFREDLYYRLAVVRLRLPPLRERTSDIPQLIEHFVREQLEDEPQRAAEVLAGITDEVWSSLLAQPWPGNVRELRNFIERTLAVSGIVDPAHSQGPRHAPLEPPLAQSEIAIDTRQPFIEAREALLGRFERAYLQRVLAEQNGNISRAARAAGLERMHFKRLLARRKDG